jgi:hypothetical protein
MAGTVISQEAGKAIYPTNGTSASEFEQGLIPGTFIGSIAQNSIGTALSKAICKGLVPGLEKMWTKPAEEAANALISKALNRGFKEIITAGVKDIVSDAARAVQFAGNLEYAFGLVAKTCNLGEGFEFLNRQLVTEIPDLVSGAAKEALTKPVLTNFLKLTHQVILPGMSQVTTPFSPAPDPIGLVDQFVGKYRKPLSSVKKMCRRGLEERGACMLPERVHDAIDSV